MEKGSKALLIILGAALLFGGLVIGFNPSYRQALLANLRGEPAASPLWQSNLEYYPEITLPESAPADTAASTELEISHDAK